MLQRVEVEGARVHESQHTLTNGVGVIEPQHVTQCMGDCALQVMHGQFRKLGATVTIEWLVEVQKNVCFNERIVPVESAGERLG